MFDVWKQFAKETIKPGDVGIPTVTADSVLRNVLDIVYFFGAAAAVIAIVVAGILYATSEGDATKVQRAKNAIIYALVGLVAIMMAFVITGFVMGRF